MSPVATSSRSSRTCNTSPRTQRPDADRSDRGVPVEPAGSAHGPDQSLKPMRKESYPETPDGRYFVAKNRLWRKNDPRLSEAERQAAVNELMD
jgi:hypothetical protein